MAVRGPVAVGGVMDGAFVTFAEVLAARVHELEAALRTARARARKLEASRDLWRHRAIRKATR